MGASANGHVEVVRALLDARATTALANEAGSRPLHWASLNGHLDVCRTLLDSGADANLRNEFDRRPFEEAFGRQHAEICELLAPKTDFSKDPIPGEKPGEAQEASLE